MTKRVVLAAVFVGCLFARVTAAGPNEDLMAAVKAADLAAVTKALDAGAKVNALDGDGNTAIAGAFFWPEITRLLLSKGADPNIGSARAVIGAAANYSTESLKLLLDAGADPNKPQYASSAAGIKTLIAAERAKGKAGNQTSISGWEALLQNPAVKNAKPVEYFALWTTVQGTSCVPCVEMLLAKGARLDQGLKEGETMMHVFADSALPTPEMWKKGFAAGKSNMEALGLKLPSWYSDTLPTDRIGTAEQMLKLLLAKGLSINLKKKATGGMPAMTPLELTLNQGLGRKREIMLALIANGADVKVTNDTYGPLILQAVQCGYADVVKAMVDKGADINQRGSVFTDATETKLLKTFTPLTTAALKNHLDVVKYLVAAGANVSMGVNGRIRDGTCLLDSRNRSAIFFAINAGNLEMVKFLAENKGFDGTPFSYTVTTAAGLSGCYVVGSGVASPSDWAAKSRAPQEMVAYLQSKGL